MRSSHKSLTATVLLSAVAAVGIAACGSSGTPTHTAASPTTGATGTSSPSVTTSISVDSFTNDITK